MTDADSFIQEVSDEVRRDRMFRLWRRYGPFAIAGLVAIVAATAVVEWREHVAAERARTDGGALLDAERIGDPAAQAQEFAALADVLGDGGAALARLRAAGALAETGAAAEARAAYAAVAETADDETLAAFAAFRAAALAGPAEGAPAAIAALEPIARGDGPFRLLALEALAAARIGAGDAAGARADLAAAGADPGATDPLRRRLAELSAALDAASPPTAGTDAPGDGAAGTN